MPRKVPYDAAAALTFDTMIRNEPSWLLSGASMLRAAHAVLRQVEIDSKARKLADESQNLIGRRRARLQLPAVFLAALGAENAFKAAIVARGLIRNHDKGLLTELPNLLGSHDLAQLAQQAHVKPADDAQRQAIANGQIIIMAIGRYHVTKRLEGTTHRDR